MTLGLRIRALVGTAVNPPAVPGFILSQFAPSVLDAANRALRDAALTEAERTLTGILLLTPCGDSETRDIVKQILDEHRRLSPLLLVQSTPTSIAGKIAADWGLTGPITTLATEQKLDGPVVAAIAVELLSDDDLTALLVIRQTPPTADTPALAAASVLSRKERT
ncbi:beta-ketoacyl synthase N-terminal-like domain-containing protein [Rathayibacter toxicus]|uniref:Beta-ketoacyl synthase-like N-terminal domain-containing protein n=1 Tax=Rathayibacter toxicus TaxID=145458 RepID=A0A2S5Y5U6_9MICO|nr:beta-ketoacyl synthase N-terminal-like domain-containing protein [Rathayibacter toxicus]ALS57999.1 hypothetical protein APU90_09685 [Rathayibacter toxicus]PPG20315.1 hypothetical protein C5D15_07220 [Rathayibacter toxicus]PPG45416.1 hypothetical protein C5D16_07185 [Rathayibacter toxicus]PPH22518.1 hypothetical protein C5D17_07230 [Rathayibacter toxicus]PPH57161.1 hypothetical protein C5D30_07215 [Rathayibacter toxicus]